MSAQAVTIRPERSEDFPIVHKLVREAFAGADHADGDEHVLVDRLRASAEYIPELSLVAEDNGQIVGHIMFTRLKVGEAVALAVAPLSVLPAYQGKGIGAALMRRGHELAKELDWEFAILLGHPSYYPRFGYKPAKPFGIVAPFEVPDDSFMAINLQGGSEHLPGLVTYSPAFFPKSPD